MTDAARLNLDTHSARTRFGDIALDDFKGSFRSTDLNGTHLGHRTTP
jgi:hypothetical protein